MISEALELCVGGRRLCHSWYICVVMDMVGWWVKMEEVDGMHAVQSQGGLVACREMPENLPSAS